MFTSEEKKERRKLVGFCERCLEWYKFTDEGQGSWGHSICGSSPSAKIGFQVTTQRTFNPAAKKLTKAQIKKMGGIGA